MLNSGNLVLNYLGRNRRDFQADTSVYQQHMEDARRSAKHTEQVLRCPDARQEKLVIRTFDEAELYDGLGSGIL